MNFNNATYEASFGNAKQLTKSDLPEIVFSGKSNVGKSTLINKLLNRKNLARTSSKPGKTGTINFYKMNNLRFVDLPGYGYAKVSDSEKNRWAELMETYFNSERNIKLVLQIIDIRHEPSQKDLEMLEFLQYNKFNFAVILTKSDKLNKSELHSQTTFYSELFDKNEIKHIVFSAVSGQGKTEIESIIKESL